MSGKDDPHHDLAVLIEALITLDDQYDVSTPECLRVKNIVENKIKCDFDELKRYAVEKQICEPSDPNKDQIRLRIVSSPSKRPIKSPTRRSNSLDADDEYLKEDIMQLTKALEMMNHQNGTLQHRCSLVGIVMKEKAMLLHYDFSIVRKYAVDREVCEMGGELGSVWISLKSTGPSKAQTIKKRKVLLLYTGGTLGCLPTDDAGSLSPAQPEVFLEHLVRIPQFSRIVQHNDKLNATDPHDLYFLGIRPFDSANLQTEHWNQICKLLMMHEDKYDAFVVIHGTDTLHFTAPALTFMLADFSKPIFITGSQRSLIDIELAPFNPKVSDAMSNLVGAMECAYSSIGFNGVFVYFHSQLMLGSRVIKTSSTHFNAFHSPNAAILGFSDCNGLTLDEGMLDILNAEKTVLCEYQQEIRGILSSETIDRGSAAAAWRKAHRLEKWKLFLKIIHYNHEHKNFFTAIHKDVTVHILRLSPTVNSMLDVLIKQSESQTALSFGVIIEAYGSGNASNEVKEKIATLRNNFVPVAFVSECHHGGVAKHYPVALADPDHGANCGDMTVQCAYVRMLVAMSSIRFFIGDEARSQAMRDSVEAFSKIIIFGSASHHPLQLSEKARRVSSFR